MVVTRTDSNDGNICSRPRNRDIHISVYGWKFPILSNNNYKLWSDDVNHKLHLMKFLILFEDSSLKRKSVCVKLRYHILLANVGRLTRTHTSDGKLNAIKPKPTLNFPENFNCHQPYIKFRVYGFPNSCTYNVKVCSVCTFWCISPKMFSWSRRKGSENVWNRLMKQRRGNIRVISRMTYYRPAMYGQSSLLSPHFQVLFHLWHISFPFALKTTLLYRNRNFMLKHIYLRLNRKYIFPEMDGSCVYSLSAWTCINKTGKNVLQISSKCLLEKGITLEILRTSSSNNMLSVAIIKFSGGLHFPNYIS